MATSSTAQPPAAATTIVHFPRRQWTTLDCKWTLVLIATAELAWDTVHTSSDTNDGPSIFRSGKVTAARVAGLVRAGRLWIGSGGRSVDLAVRSTFVGKPIPAGEDGDHFRDQIRNILLGWQIWEDELGLRVRNDRVELATGADDIDAGILHLTVNHPPSPRGLYTPRADGGIPQARLQRVSCQLDMNFCEDGFKLSPPIQAAQQQQKARPRTKKKTRRQRAPKKKPHPPPKAPRYKTGRVSRHRIQQQKEPQVIELKDVLLTDSIAWQKATILIEMAFHMLVGTSKAGRKARVPGVRPVDRLSMPGGAPGLLDVAPAAWNNDYFTAVSSRATYIPLIHRFLESFTNAQSPSLRRKAEALTRGSQDESERPGAQEGQLGTKLEEILLKGVLQLPPRVKKPVTKPPTSRVDPSQELHGAPPTPGHSSIPRPSDPDFLSQTSSLDPDSLQDLFAASCNEALDDEVDNSQFIDLCLDSLGAVFSLSPDYSDSPGRLLEEVEEDIYGENDTQGRELAWDDIEAWSEPNEYLHDEDGLFQEIDESRSPEGRSDREIEDDGEGALEENRDEGDEEDVDDNLYEDLSLDESGIVLWQEMQAGHLGQWRDDDDQEIYYGEYMDDEDLGFVDMDVMDLDEGVGLWRDENDIIEDCC